MLSIFLPESYNEASINSYGFKNPNNRGSQIAGPAGPALVKRSGVRTVFISLSVSLYGLVHLWRTKGLTDCVSWRIRGLAVRWRPRPPGTRQYGLPSSNKLAIWLLSSLSDQKNWGQNTPHSGLKLGFPTALLLPLKGAQGGHLVCKLGKVLGPQ